MGVTKMYATDAKYNSAKYYEKESLDAHRCPICGISKKIKDYYPNKNFYLKDKTPGIDLWCKKCALSCHNKYNIMKYFIYNNKKWDENKYEKALANAKEKLQHEDYAYRKCVEDGNENAAKRKEEIEAVSRLKAARSLQKVEYEQHYDDYGNIKKEFEDKLNEYLNKPIIDKSIVKNNNDNNNDISKEEFCSEETEEELQDEKNIYSEKFNGYFTEKDLKYLENYYDSLEEDFTFDNESLRDYAKKVCKASLQADKSMDLYARGMISYDDVKNAMSQFDMLSKSANFAACKRKDDQGNGITSWAQTTMYLCENGRTMTRKIIFPQDDIDKCIQEQRHLAAALGLDSI